MVELVLGVVRFLMVISVESSVGITARTNLGVSTLGAITAAIRHYHQKNIQVGAFIFLATTGAAGAFIGSYFRSYVPIALLPMIIGLIVSYESFALLKGSRIKKKGHNNIKNNNDLDEISNDDRILNLSKNRLLLLESIVGFGIGFLGGVVGLVLGSIRIPAMISILKMEPRVAVGTNLAAASVMGISGLIGHNKSQYCLSCPYYNWLCCNVRWIYWGKIYKSV